MKIPIMKSIAAACRRHLISRMAHLRYQQYLAATEPDDVALRSLQENVMTLSATPHISFILLATGESASRAAATVDSFCEQAYHFWDVVVFLDASRKEEQTHALHSGSTDKCRVFFHSDITGCASLVRGDYVAFMRPGVRARRHMLLEVVRKINECVNAELIYCDEDSIVDSKRSDPFFKPDWDPDLLLSTNYIGNFFIMKRELFNRIGGVTAEENIDPIYDLLLRATEASRNIEHIPMVLYSQCPSFPTAADAGRNALESAIRRRRLQAGVVPLSRPGLYRVRRKIEADPRVTIVIPTSYKSPDVLMKCLRSIVQKTSYRNYELLLMDNSHGLLTGDDLAKMLPNYADYRRLLFELPFNYSAINNAAAREAQGEYLLFLNDDTEVINADWIEAMLEHAQRSEVGAVGAKLYYPNNTIQHAGVILGAGGKVLHAHRYCPRAAPGYRGMLAIVHEVSAVTGACVMIRKQVFAEVGGFDEGYELTFGDIDCCLKIREKGYLVLWTPFAELYHHELKTRGYDNTAKKKQRFNKEETLFWTRWKNILKKGDPYYSPNLSQDRDDYWIRIK